ncbi:MAG: glutamate synthase domain-containing protein 2 [Arenicella sp.]|jgi:glutamate synthase domain-containing protein 2
MHHHIASYTIGSFKRFIIRFAVIILNIIFIGFSFNNAWWVMVLVFTFPLLVIGIYDRYQKKWTLTRNYHLTHGGDLVWEIGSGYFGCRKKDGSFDELQFTENATRETVKMVGIKFSQSAKPRHGGLLPAEKVTDEIVRFREVSAHQDCLSPRGHSTFSTPIELLEFAARLRELSGAKPVGIKLCVGHTHEILAIVKAMLKTSIHLDYIVVYGGEGGTGTAPVEFSDFVGMPLADGLITVRNALAGTGLRDKVRLGASAKVYSAIGMARNIALGADWSNAARAFVFSIGCIQAQRCHTGNCPTGITTQDLGRQCDLVDDVQVERVARFHKQTLAALSSIVASTGLAHPSELQPFHLIQRTGATEAKMICRVYDFLPENSLLDSPKDTYFSEWWQAVSTDSFIPQINLASMRDQTGHAKLQDNIT